MSSTLSTDEAAAGGGRNDLAKGEIPTVGYCVSVLGAAEVELSHDFRSEWDRLALSSANLYALFQSPIWWDYGQLSRQSEHRALSVVKTEAGCLVGVAPVRTCRHPLTFGWSGRELGKTYLRGLTIVGNQPILPENEGVLVQVVDSLLAAFPECDCISMAGMLIHSHCWELLANSQKLRQHVSVHLSRGTQPHNLITIPASFDEYLATFKAKSRYNLRRQVKRLREKGCGHLELVRADKEEHVVPYVDRAAAIAAKSWQGKSLDAVVKDTAEDCRRLGVLAKHGVLRSYVLQCGDVDCAFVRGYQYQDMYYYAWCGFDPSLADYSPGAVLLYLILEDLCNRQSPKHLSFLWGDAAYKKRFGSQRLEDGSALLVRRDARISTRARLGLHALWRACGRVAKRRKQASQK